MKGLRGFDYLDWDRLLDGGSGTLVRRREGPHPATTAPPPDPKAVRKAFQTAREEFQKAGTAMRKMMKLFIVLVGISAMLAIAGAILVTAYRFTFMGGAISLVGISGMFAFFTRLFRMGRDQALFEFLPARYELALCLAQTPEQFARLLDAFMLETEAYRSIEKAR